METLVPILLVLGGFAAAVGSWAVARRFGWRVGLTIPVLVAVAWAWRSAMPLGHPEEAMGRGLEQMFLWLPLLVATVAGFVAGLMSRRR